ncbi:MAG TPA: alpha/beta hydrolase-fold protein [Thermoanaerobaculia bacterium]|nr:alpha/beta hydrolase-fold protein [Thermoanaerobaculia bacterium]
MRYLLDSDSLSELHRPDAPSPAQLPSSVEAAIPGSLAGMRIGEVNVLGPFLVPGLAPRNVRVYLPHSYSPDRLSFGLYMFDGQNLFGDAPSFAGGWRLHEAIERLARRGRPAPVAVGIDHGGPARIQELSPFEVLSAPGQSPLLLDWITQSLMPALEAELNLIPGPLGAVIGGSSMGGLCALWSHFHYPRAFGGALAKSPSFWIADQAIFADIEAQPLPPVSRIYLDAGGREDKGRHLPLAAAMASELSERGYDADRLMWRPDARGTHSEASWRRRLPKALQFFYRQ